MGNYSVIASVSEAIPMKCRLPRRFTPRNDIEEIMAKVRLTITLDEGLLKRVDRAIDGTKIRNRSPAIESLLKSSLSPTTTKVLILAVGEGVKFRPLTYELPKALIPIRGRPLLEHTLMSLRHQGFSEIVISLGHFGEKIREHFGDGKNFGLRISYLDQARKKQGTAQPVLEAKSILGDDGSFLVIYGDVLTKLNFSDILDYHSSHRGVATMALASVEKTIPIISDEIYDEMSYREHVSPCALSSDVKFIQLNGMSKGYLATGWRMGYMSVSEGLEEL